MKHLSVLLPVRHYASAVFAVILCLSICCKLVVSKWLNLGTQKQRCTIAHGLWFFGEKDLYEILIGSSQMGMPNEGGICKNYIFRPVKKSPAQMPYR